MTIRKLIIFAIISVFLTLGCTKDEVEGPLINEIYGNFEIIQPLLVSNKTPNFSNNEITKFYASFNKKIDWKINIFGLSSNGKKEITGFSNELDSTIVFWNGNTSQLPFFIEEDCAVELTFLNESDTLRDTITIAGAKVYDDGIIVADFENGVPSNALVSWTANIGLRTFDTAHDDPLLGKKYFQMGGRVNWDWPIGKIDFELNLSSISSSADNFYINIGILSDTVDLHTGQFLNILISESDLPFNDNLPDNVADIFDNDEEVYKLNIPVDWHGWRVLSLKYSDFEALAPNATGVVFNKNPNDIKGIRIASQACPAAGSNPNCPENMNRVVRTDIDHLIFTENGGLFD